jgi:hypothetical protein
MVAFVALSRAASTGWTRPAAAAVDLNGSVAAGPFVVLNTDGTKHVDTSRMAHRVDGPEAWDRLMETLPELLDRLKSSHVYGAGGRPPADQRGVYLFSKDGTPLYVGRTSVTARSRAAGNLTGRSFRARYSEHTNESSPPGSAPFAARLARERAQEEGFKTLPPNTYWWQHRDDPEDSVGPVVARLNQLFSDAKREIANMECRILPLEDDTKGVRSSIVETYAHVQLNTPYNDFSTS